MAEFPITTAREDLGFTPSTAVRANIDVSQGPSVGAAVGQGLVELAEAGLEKRKERLLREEKIREKRREMQDANSAVIASKLRKTADAEFGTYKLTNPQETWEKFRQEQTQKVSEEVAGLDFSPDALITEQVKSESYSIVQTAQALTAATRQLRQDTIDAQTESLTDAFRTGKPEEIADAIKRYRDNGANMGKDKVEVLADIKAARAAGEKLRKQDVVDSWQDRIAVDPVSTEITLEAELEARKTGEGNIPELDSADIQSLLNTATNRKTQLMADAQAELNAKNKALETELHNQIIAGAPISEIKKSTLPAEAQRRLETDLANIDKRNVARTWAIQDSSDATEQINALLTNQEAGRIDINEARHGLSLLTEFEVDGRSIVSKKTFDGTMVKITNGGRDFVDKFVAKEMEFIKGYLLPRSLTLAESELKIRQLAGTLTGTQRRQFASVGFLIQVAQHQVLLIQDSVDKRIRDAGIEDTSGKEAKAIVAEEWLLVKEKTLAQKMQEYTIASGQKLIIPFGFPQKTWEDANPRIRSVIIQAVSENMDNKTILDLLDL